MNATLALITVYASPSVLAGRVEGRSSLDGVAREGTHAFGPFLLLRSHDLTRDRCSVLDRLHRG